MAEIKHTIKLAGQISPTDTQDVYPTHEDIYGKGGYMSVSTLSERDAIPSPRRKLGMTVAVPDAVTGKTTRYTLEGGLTNAHWVVDAGGGGMAEAPLDGGTYGRRLGAWRLLNFESVNPTYVTVPTGGDNRISINHASTPFAALTLDAADEFHYITITGIEEGSWGSLQIKQTRDKQVVMENMYGEFVMPGRRGDLYVVDYLMRDGHLYGTGHAVSVLGEYRVPATVIDFAPVAYDTTSAGFRWTAPHGDLPSDAVDRYDIRYSSTPVDADNAAVWSRMTPVNSFVMQPQAPGELETFTTALLQPDGHYYFYLKSVQYIKGKTYTSRASNMVYFATRGSMPNDEQPYRIPLTEDNIFLHNPDVMDDDEGIPRRKRYLVDEVDKLVINTDDDPKNPFNKKGYPEVKHSNYETMFAPVIYARNTAYYRVTIDLFQVYRLDRLFLSAPNGRTLFTIFGCRGIGQPVEELGEYNPDDHNFTKTVLLHGREARYLMLQWDRQLFDMADKPVIAPGDYGFPEPYYNSSIAKMHNLMIYGHSVEGKPDGIMPVKRRYTTLRTMDEWLCTNGHFYQVGNLHRWLSGPNVRLYGHGGHFSPAWNDYATQADVKFKLNDLSWVRDNGWGGGLRSLLEQSYKRFGLRPIICFTGCMDCVRIRWEDFDNYPIKNVTYCCQVDNNNSQWYDWIPQPRNVPRGLDEYLSYTASPEWYKTYAKVGYALGALYGKVNRDDVIALLAADLDTLGGTVSGLDCLGGVEFENEQDRGWQGFIAYHLPEQCAAISSATFDADHGKLVDAAGGRLLGIKTADPSLQHVMGGMATNAAGYILNMLIYGGRHRGDASFPSDWINGHIYCPSSGLGDGSVSPPSYAITMERYLSPDFDAGRRVREFFNVRDYYAPHTRLKISEFGYGEGGAVGSDSRFQCFSQPGRKIGTWLIPDRHRSDVKGAWTVRGLFQLLELGAEEACLYLTYTDTEWWYDNPGAGGPRGEMFDWQALTGNEYYETTPGAKFAAVPPSTNNDRTGFACFGFFGHYLSNGAYPISRALWFVTLFRSRLKDHYYVGRLKHAMNDRIMIYAFKHKTENRGCYAVYYNDEVNTGLPGVPIRVPVGNAQVDVYREYIPEVPDPRTVPNTRGMDQYRTGLPTSRREKYVGGEWVIQNPKWNNKYEAFAAGAATYPDNPQEGDEVTVLPTEEENPWFPIVGPTAATFGRSVSPSGEPIRLGADQYEYESSSSATGFDFKYNKGLILRQHYAIDDYIALHPEGVKGRTGIKTTMEVMDNTVTLNVSEYPQYIVFNGTPQTTYESRVPGVKAKAVNPTSMQVWWNNECVHDTHYEVWQSITPTDGYSLVATVPFGTNTTVIKNLVPDTSYYYRVLPKLNDLAGTMSEPGVGKTTVHVEPVKSLSIAAIGLSTITVSWECDELPDEFAYFSLMRAVAGGEFKFLCNIETPGTLLAHVDAGLLFDTEYAYKIMVVTSKGHSEYSAVATARTLAEETTAPQPVSMATDSIGSRIMITFNAGLSAPAAGALSGLVLREGDAVKTIKNLRLDGVDSRVLVLELDLYTLQVASAGQAVTVQYTPPASGGLQGLFGTQVLAWPATVVENIVGRGIVILGAEVLEAVDGVVVDPRITLRLNTYGTPAQYRASESPDLAPLPWADAPAEGDIGFVLSAGDGTKRIYLQARNYVEDSNVYALQVQHVESLAITAFTVGDSNITVSRNIAFTLGMIGVTATHYRASENAAALEAMEWEFLAATMPLQLSEGFGVKRVYVQIKNDELTSPVFEGTVTYAESLANTVVIAMNKKANANQHDIVDRVGYVNHTATNFDKRVEDAELLTTRGERWGTLLRKEAHYGETYNRLNIGYSGWSPAGSNDLVGNTGFVPDAYFTCYCAVAGAKEGRQAVMKFVDVAPGTYTIKLYVGTNGDSYAAQEIMDAVYWEINGVQKFIDFSTLKNVTRYIEFTGVVVSDGTLNIWFKQTEGSMYDQRPGVNLLRIEKTA